MLHPLSYESYSFWNILCVLQSQVLAICIVIKIQDMITHIYNTKYEKFISLIVQISSVFPGAVT